MSNFYTLAEVRDRRTEQLLLGFDIPDCYSALTDAQIARAANGVGPDSMPRIVRGLLTDLVEYLDLAADIHDVEYRFSDGRRDTFLKANRRLYHNGRIWIMAKRGRLNPLRYLELWRCRRDLSILNGPQGWDAWIAAWKRYGGQPL